jgi:hypothetical protein
MKFHVKNVVLFFLVETITKQLSMGRKNNGNETTNKTDKQHGTVHFACKFAIKLMISVGIVLFVVIGLRFVDFCKHWPAGLSTRSITKLQH